MKLDFLVESNSAAMYSLLVLAWWCHIVAIPTLPLSIINNMSGSLNKSSFVHRKWVPEAVEDWSGVSGPFSCLRHGVAHRSSGQGIQSSTQVGG